MYMRERFKECLVINEKKYIYISNNYKVNPGSFVFSIYSKSRHGGWMHVTYSRQEPLQSIKHGVKSQVTNNTDTNEN